MRSRRSLRLLRLFFLGAALFAAACARQLPPPARPLPRATPPPVQAPRPAPPAPAPAPPAEEPAPEPAPPAAPSAPRLLKVGLASDLPSVALPCCEEGISARVGDQEVALVAPLRVEPAAATAEQGFYRLQVAALRDERQATDLAKRLERQTGQPAAAHFDAGVDLYRVRLGRYDDRATAERELRRLSTLGVTGAWVVSEGARVTAPALRVTQGAVATTYPGRWLAVSTGGARGIRAEGKRYRGRILVFLNDRGTLNLINELPVEEYLRGVVPSELGPEAYPQLEAIKAQAVAARTYALRNLGEFAREGYDICATPRCQVYGGMEVEHPLSDLAVRETAGQVLLYQGRLVDALYSSTCGGHTEDARVIFPLKLQDPYLKGVPCVEAGLAHLEGNLPRGVDFPGGLTRRLLPPAADTGPAAGLQARFEHLALLAGLPPPSVRLASLDRREVQRYLAAALDLALDARLLMAPEDVEYLLQDPPADWSAEDRRRAAYLLKSGLLNGPPDRPLGEPEVEGMLLALAEMLQVVRREDVTFLAVGDGRLTVKSGKEERVQLLPPGFATFRRSGAAIASAPLAIVAGDHLTIYWLGGGLLALVQEVDLDGVAFDRSSKYSSWTRFRSDAQLARQVQTRFPGLGFRDFEVLTRGSSGRVGKIRIHGTSGEAVEVEGLAVRWTLDLPDTLFTARRLDPPTGEAGWLFTGRGWGHGVGMCQVGAYGMAQRGHTYREILQHYFSGVELGRVRGPAAAASPAGR